VTRAFSLRRRWICRKAKTDEVESLIKGNTSPPPTAEPLLKEKPFMYLYYYFVKEHLRALPTNTAKLSGMSKIAIPYNMFI
jgi:hypothetical protein